MITEGKHIVYLLGIGGIGMSAIARWYNLTGLQVLGYDKTPSPLTDTLRKEGISVNFIDHEDEIPPIIKDNREICLIIRTPAIPEHNRQLRYLMRNGYEIRKRSEVLGDITNGLYTIAIAGTHGKTTTASMITHFFKVADKNFISFLGGIPVNYQTNMVINGSPEDIRYGIVEADEYDRSFHRLKPDEAIVTSADPDHLDVYGDLNSMRTAYTKFINLLPQEGKLLIQNKLTDLIPEERNDLHVKSYGLNEGEIVSGHIRIKGTASRFDYFEKETELHDILLPQPGYHNIENALAAIHCALSHGIPDEKIREGLGSYLGIKRRFEFIINKPGCIFIDDYAHHPEEIKALMHSIRDMFPGKKITAIFQPHLFTRTRDFHREFASSLGFVDQVILLEIYPAREEPLKGVTSALIYESLRIQDKMMVNKEDLVKKVKDLSTEVVVTIGAGDIDRLIKPLKEALNKK